MLEFKFLAKMVRLQKSFVPSLNTLQSVYSSTQMGVIQ